MDAYRPARPVPERRTVWGRDVLIAAGVAVIQVVGSFGAAHGETGHRSLDALAIVLLLAGPALLIFRHRAPSAVLVGVLGITLLYFVRDYPHGPVFLSLIVAFVAAVSMGRRRVAIASLIVGYAGFMWLGWLVGTTDDVVGQLQALAAVGVQRAVLGHCGPAVVPSILRVRTTSRLRGATRRRPSRPNGLPFAMASTATGLSPSSRRSRRDCSR